MFLLERYHVAGCPILSRSLRIGWDSPDLKPSGFDSPCQRQSPLLSLRGPFFGLRNLLSLAASTTMGKGMAT
jgi:hypothetical protein